MPKIKSSDDVKDWTEVNEEREMLVGVVGEVFKAVLGPKAEVDTNLKALPLEKLILFLGAAKMAVYASALVRQELEARPAFDVAVTSRRLQDEAVARANRAIGAEPQG
jgi:hypothetical protein